MFDEIEVGDKILMVPDPRPRNAWTVTARNDEHIVAVRQAPFRPKGEVEYTITGTLNGGYNGVRSGLVRSSLNTLGGGWELDGRVEEGSREIIEALESGDFELSLRRVYPLDSLEKKA